MDAKTKANELFSKFYAILIEADSDISQEILITDLSKKCAIRCIEEILEAIDWHEFETPNDELNYWEQVKNEINQL